MVSSISKRVKSGNYQYRALKIGDDDQRLLQFIAQGQWTVSGFRNRDLALALKIPAEPKTKRRLTDRIKP